MLPKGCKGIDVVLDPVARDCVPLCIASPLPRPLLRLPSALALPARRWFQTRRSTVRTRADAAQNLDILGVDGRWVLYSLLSGPALPDEQAKAFFGSMAKKRISLLATTLRTRPRPYKSTLVHRFARDVLPKLASGQMVHLIDTTFRGLEHAQSVRAQSSAGC
jgi:hypothetical protein